jgi:hypothetical protein
MIIRTDSNAVTITHFRGAEGAKLPLVLRLHPVFDEALLVI